MPSANMIAKSSLTRARFRAPIHVRAPIHDGISRPSDRLYVGFDSRKSEPLVEARVAAIKRFQIAASASFIGLRERGLHEPRTDTLALGGRGHADYGQVPGGLVNNG